MNNDTDFRKFSLSYLETLHKTFTGEIIESINMLCDELLYTWINGHSVFICGNGGSAANALHIANDLHYGIGVCRSGNIIPGLKVEALSANPAIITCLANDIGYENIFSNQLNVKAKEGDLLIVLSGSGNSKNIINALKVAKDLNIRSHAITAFDGGICREVADNPIHFKVDDMQIAEDTQLIVSHICMQWLNANKPKQSIRKT